MASMISRTAPYGDVVRALAAAQKSSINVSFYSRFLNRPLGRLLAAASYKLGLSPNAVTFISACFTFLGIGWIAVSGARVLDGVVIALLLIVGYAMDSADGQVARLEGGGRPVGEWLDHVVDCLKMSTFHLAVLVMWFRHPAGWPSLTLLVPLVFAVQAAVMFFAFILTDVLERLAESRAVRKRALRSGSWLNSLLSTPADYGLMIFTLFLLGFTDLWRGLYATLCVYCVLLLCVQLVRWFKRMSTLG